MISDQRPQTRNKEKRETNNKRKLDGSVGQQANHPLHQRATRTTFDQPQQNDKPFNNTMRLSHRTKQRPSRLFRVLIGLVLFALLVLFAARSQSNRLRITPSEYLTATSTRTEPPISSDKQVVATIQPAASQEKPTPITNDGGPDDNGVPSFTNLYRPPLDRSTSHYNFSAEVMPDEFLDHLQHLTKRIDRNWRSKGWRSFDKVNISTCAALTPECQLFREVLSPQESALGEKAYRKCCVEHKRLASVAHWTIEKLEEAGIPYFLSTGTALGARRHGGTIIPWDTDVDLAIFPNGTELLKQTFQKNKLHYFHKDINDKPMYWIHHSANGKPAGGPHVEIFADPVYTKYPTKLLPLETCYFYGHRVKCPGQGMFSVWFPSGWQSYGGGHYHGDHRCTIYKKGKRIETEKC